MLNEMEIFYNGSYVAKSGYLNVFRYNGKFYMVGYGAVTEMPDELLKEMFLVA
jgi:hypothetical protein